MSTKVWTLRLGKGRARVTISEDDSLVHAEVAADGSDDPLTKAQERAAFEAAKQSLQSALESLDRYIKAIRA